MHDLPPFARVATDHYLDAVDQALPGLVEGCYVTGSLALGDFHPGISDIDLLAICSHAPGRGEVAALTGVHQRLHSKPPWLTTVDWLEPASSPAAQAPGGPNVDVVYATAEDLRSDPTTLALPHSLAGALKPSGDSATPVLWRSLTTHGIAVRGEPILEETVWFDPETLRRWNLTNLDTYWANKIDEYTHRWTVSDQTVRHEYGLQWLVLGVPRLHYTIATLEVTSKTGAGRYALDIVQSSWHPVIRTAIALRANQQAPLTQSPDELWRDGLDLATWLIDDAHRIFRPDQT